MGDGQRVAPDGITPRAFHYKEVLACVRGFPEDARRLRISVVVVGRQPPTIGALQLQVRVRERAQRDVYLVELACLRSEAEEVRISAIIHRAVQGLPDSYGCGILDRVAMFVTSSGRSNSFLILLF